MRSPRGGMRWRRRRRASTSTSAASTKPRPSSRRPSNGPPPTAAAPPRPGRCWDASWSADLEVRAPMRLPAVSLDATFATMIRRVVLLVLALSALAAPVRAKDELVVAMTQTPGTWNPLISSMLAKSLISNMTARPLTAYDANSQLVCLACTELPTIENGKARVVDLPDDGKGGGKKGMEVDVELRDLKWGDGVPVTAKDVAFTLEVGKHPLSGVASSEGYRRIIKFD